MRSRVQTANILLALPLSETVVNIFLGALLNPLSSYTINIVFHQNKTPVFTHIYKTGGKIIVSQKIFRFLDYIFKNYVQDAY